MCQPRCGDRADLDNNNNNNWMDKYFILYAPCSVLTLRLGHQVNDIRFWSYEKTTKRKLLKCRRMYARNGTVGGENWASISSGFRIFPSAFDIEIYWNYVVAHRHRCNFHFHVLLPPMFSRSEKIACIPIRRRAPTCVFVFVLDTRVSADNVICNEHKIDRHALMRHCVRQKRKFI